MFDRAKLISIARSLFSFLDSHRTLRYFPTCHMHWTALLIFFTKLKRHDDYIGKKMLFRLMVKLFCIPNFSLIRVTNLPLKATSMYYFEILTLRGFDLH